MEQDEYDRKIKQDFIREALEMLSGVEDQFLLFEQNPGDSKVVDKIFRIAHTVKASAMTCGFKRLGEFAHLMETLLVMIREGQHIPDSETVDVFLRANDTLRAYLDLLRNDFDAVLNTDLIKEDLMHFIGHEVKSTSAVLMSGFGCFHDSLIGHYKKIALMKCTVETWQLTMRVWVQLQPRQRWRCAPGHDRQRQGLLHQRHPAQNGA